MTQNKSLNHMIPKLFQDLNAVEPFFLDRNEDNIELIITIANTPHTMTLLFPILSILLRKKEPWNAPTTCVNLRPYTPQDLIELVTYILKIPNNPIINATYPHRLIRQFLTNPNAWWPLRKE